MKRLNDMLSSSTVCRWSTSILCWSPTSVLHIKL